MNKTISAGLISLLLPFLSYAQDTNNLEDVVVTAARTPQKNSDVLSDVSVITQKQIQLAGQTSLVELLRTQPGIEMAQNGGVGKTSSIFMRGANATHTLVLIDGMRVSSATSGTTSLENIPLDQIERIEILRGPASSLYGADAIGGVIQIFTKSAKGTPRFNASFGLGTYGTSIASAGVNGRVSDTSFSAQVGTISTNGVSAIANSTLATYNSDDDGYHNKNISIKLAQHLGDNHEIGITGFYSDGTSHYDGGARTPLARPRNQFDYYGVQRLSSYGIYSKNRFTSNWLSTLRAGQSEDDADSYAPNTANTLKVKSTFRTTQNQYSWQNDITTQIGLFTVGAERLEQNVDSTTLFKQDGRNIQSWLAGWQHGFGSNNVQVNLRNDDNSQFGNHTTGSVGYGYQLSPNWRANASYGTSFAAPTFNQLYNPLDTSINYVGNPDLKAEEGRNKEVGLHYVNGTQNVGAVYYYNDVDNLIANTTRPINGVNRLSPINVNEAILKGLSLSYSGSISGLNIYANADFQRPEDAETGNLLPRRAKEHGTFGVSKRFGEWEIGSDVESSSYRYNDIRNRPIDRMSGYTLVNIYTNYRINPDWSLNARVNNLFDRTYELAQNYGTFGTNLMVTVRYAPGT